MIEVGDVLVRRGLLDRRQLEQARASLTDGMRVDQAAIKLGLASEADAYWAKRWGSTLST